MMDYFTFFATFIPGAIMGSFLNVIIYRLPRGLSLVSPKSHCTSCNATLNWYENVPIISYLLQRGKCRHCGEKYSPRYLLVEISTGLIFSFSYYLSIGTMHFFFLVSVSMLLLAIGLIDFEFYYIPDSLLIISLALSIIYIGVTNGHWIYLNFISAFVVFVVFYLVRFIAKILYKKDSFGMGDVKLAAFLGFLLGWQHALVAIFFGFFMAAIIIIFLLLIEKIERSSYIPFAPFLVLGLIIYIYCGEAVTHWYLHTFVG